ncbi:MAG: hypothetical protein EXR79_10900 [Myxococcales bacterium]|nr:hypothetical protein [Myxococcales bacterium]
MIRISLRWRALVATGVAMFTTLLAPAPAAAVVPATTLVEGVLTSVGGGPAADGSYSILFSLYKDETGGSPAFTEGPVTIGVKNGVFSYALGSKTKLEPGLLGALGGGWLALKVEQDAELARRPLHAVAYAVRASVAEALECSGCIGDKQIDANLLAKYAKLDQLALVAMSGDYKDLKGSPPAPDLSAYPKKTDLKPVATTGEYKDLTGGPDLSAYKKFADLPAVAQTGKFPDLTAIPKFAELGQACGTALVMQGIKADGSYDCVANMDLAALPADGIDEISNKLIFNQFVDSFDGKTNVPIKDNFPTGVTDEIDFPDIGVSQKLSVAIDVANSDVSTVAVTLVDPKGGKFELWKGDGSGGQGGKIIKVYPDPDKTVSGDLTKWFGQNPQGKWKLIVFDAGFKDNGIDGQLNKWTISIQTLSNKKIRIAGDLYVDNNTTMSGNLVVNGTLTVNGDYLLRPATFRLAQFHTYQHAATSWFMGNNSAMYGGISPSVWTDGNAHAGAISADKEVQRTLFTEKRWAGKNALVCSELYNMHSSTNGFVCAALFRVRNLTAGNLTWTAHFYYTAFDGWSEQASVAVNGSNIWTAGNTSNTSVGLVIPANRVSTVIFTTTSTAPYTYLSNHHERATLLGFHNNSLALPAGLQFIDDLDIATGGYEK